MQILQSGWDHQESDAESRISERIHKLESLILQMRRDLDRQSLMMTATVERVRVVEGIVRRFMECFSWLGRQGPMRI